MTSGSAAHPLWADALAPLDAWGKRSAPPTLAERSLAVRLLATRRKQWTSASPRLQLRAARHYERAAALTIGACVAQTAHAAPLEGRPLSVGEWVRADAPARVDLAGGWTDTPPICYERRGLVIAAAVSVGGRMPIGARARRIAEPVIILRTRSHPDIVRSKAIEDSRCLVIETLDEMGGLSLPRTAGALAKAVLVATGVISLSGDSLAKQLAEGGLEIESWSSLPVGSGMGTSSIMGVALVAAIGRVLGRSYEPSALIHAILNVEQILSTGGGWQACLTHPFFSCVTAHAFYVSPYHWNMLLNFTTRTKQQHSSLGLLGCLRRQRYQSM